MAAANSNRDVEKPSVKIILIARRYVHVEECSTGKWIRRLKSEIKIRESVS